MINKFIFILNNILSFIIKFFRKIHNNWPKLRKIFILFIFIVLFALYIQSPEIKLQLSNTARLTILQYEKNADNYMASNDFDNAINQYKSAISIILSQKNINDINIDKDIQYRICKKAANAFLKYSSINTIDESHKKTCLIFIEGLNLQKENFKDDMSIDSLIKKMNLAIS